MSEKNSIRLFENPEFGQVRTVIIDDEPWFVGKDVALALGYGTGKSLANAVAKHVEADDKGVTEMMTPGGKQNITIINESGLYSLILSSKLPKAKEFKKWVTSEVLPAIRKNGVYATPEFVQKSISDPQWAIAVLQNLVEVKKENERLEAENKEQKETISIMEPKAEYHDEVLDSEGALTTTVIAKEYGLTAQKLNKYLHEKGIQYKVGKTWVLYDKYADKGYMETKTFVDDNNVSHVTSYWTQAGRRFIFDILKDSDIAM